MVFNAKGFLILDTKLPLEKIILHFKGNGKTKNFAWLTFHRVQRGISPH